MKRFALVCLSLILRAGTALAAFVIFSAVAVSGGGSDPTANVLPSYNDAYANWNNAGLAVIGGIPSVTTQCGSTVTPSGITPPARGDDASKIQAAIKACSAGQFVQLGSGTFQLDITENIWLNKGIVLRGTGSCTNASSPYCSTVINTYNGPLANYVSPVTCGVSGAGTACPNPSAGLINVGPASGPYAYGWAGYAAAPTDIDPSTVNVGAKLAADVAQGATTVQVASTANFSVGGWVLIDEAPALVSTTNPTGGANIQASPEWPNTSGSPAVMRMANPDGGCTYGFCTDRDNGELHLVKAIGAGPCPGTACTLTFDDPLTIAFRQSGSHDARVYWPTQHSVNKAQPFITRAGVENLTITRPNGGGINFEFCAYCWAKNVEVGFWVAGAMNVTYSARVQITGNYLHDCVDCQNNGNEYPLSITTASTEVLADNNIILLGGKGMVGRAANSSVIANNYVDETFYETTSGQIGDYWVDTGVNGSHYAGTHHWLFEGNWATNCDNDETHGNALYHTYFRNWCTGYRSPFTDPSISRTVNDIAGTGWKYSGGIVAQTPSPLRAAGPMGFNYWDAWVGNVLGTTSTTTANGWVYSINTVPTGQVKTIWLSGWTGSEWSSNPDVNLNGATHSYIFKHGNYDYVNGSIVDWTTGYSHTLPNSFYLGSAPSYFGASGTHCTYAWPWVTPTGGSQIQTPTGSGCSATDGLPAKARWAAGTPFVQP